VLCLETLTNGCLPALVVSTDQREPHELLLRCAAYAGFTCWAWTDRVFTGGRVKADPSSPFARKLEREKVERAR